MSAINCIIFRYDRIKIVSVQQFVEGFTLNEQCMKHNLSENLSPPSRDASKPLPFFDKVLLIHPSLILDYPEKTRNI